MIELPTFTLKYLTSDLQFAVGISLATSFRNHTFSADNIRGLSSVSTHCDVDVVDNYYYSIKYLIQLWRMEISYGTLSETQIDTVN